MFDKYTLIFSIQQNKKKQNCLDLDYTLLPCNFLNFSKLCMCVDEMGLCAIHVWIRNGNGM